MTIFAKACALRIIVTTHTARVLPDRTTLTAARTAQVSKGSQYPTLLKALIVQSMIKIEEDKITVICREADIPAVKSVVDVSTYLGILREHPQGGIACTHFLGEK